MKLIKKTDNYDKYLAYFRSDIYLLKIVRSEWIGGRYDENLDSGDAFEKSTFFHNASSSPQDFRQEYYRTSQEEVISEIKQNIRNLNQLEDSVVITANDHIFPPDCQLVPHVDHGKASGCSIIFPVLGSLTFTYDELGISQVVDNIYIYNNKVRHMAKNNLKNFMSIFLVFHIGCPLENLLEGQFLK